MVSMQWSSHTSSQPSERDAVSPSVRAALCGSDCPLGEVRRRCALGLCQKLWGSVWVGEEVWFPG